MGFASNEEPPHHHRGVCRTRALGLGLFKVTQVALDIRIRRRIPDGGQRIASTQASDQVTQPGAKFSERSRGMHFVAPIWEKPQEPRSKGLQSSENEVLVRTRLSRINEEAAGMRRDTKLQEAFEAGAQGQWNRRATCIVDVRHVQFPTDLCLGATLPASTSIRIRTKSRRLGTSRSSTSGR